MAKSRKARFPLLIASASLAIACASASAQVLEQAESLFVQPFISRDSGGFSSCGLRLVVTVMSKPQTVAYDFSVNIYQDRFALAKVGRYTFTKAQITAKSKPVADLPAPVGFWLAAANKGATTVMGKSTPSQDRGFSTGLISTDGAATNIYDIMRGEPMQFSAKYQGEEIDRVYGFAPHMQQADISAIDSCVTGLIGRADAQPKK